MTALRDVRLARALDHAPDAQDTPPAAVRESIRRQAHAAVAHATLARAPRPAPGALPWWRRLWRRGAGTRARRPWNTALASMLLAGVVTSLWWDREVPGPDPDTRPVASAPSPATTPRDPPRVSDAAQAPSNAAKERVPQPPTAAQRSASAAAARAEGTRPEAPAPVPASAPPLAESRADIPTPPTTAAPAPPTTPPVPATAAAPSTSPHGDTATEVLRRHAARAVPPAYRAGTATPAEDASQAGAAALERPSSAIGSRGWNTLFASTPQGTATTWQRAELPDDVSRSIDLLMLRLARPEPSSDDAPVLLRITLQRDGLVLGELALGRTHMRWTPAADAMPSAFEAPLEARHAERLRAALLR